VLYIFASSFYSRGERELLEPSRRARPGECGELGEPINVVDPGRCGGRRRGGHTKRPGLIVVRDSGGASRQQGSLIPKRAQQSNSMRETSRSSANSPASGMMDDQKALEEADGNIDKAVSCLRLRAARDPEAGQART